MKKGFTLIELLGVIIILGVIGLIAYPIVNNAIRVSEQKAYDSLIYNLEEAAYNYGVNYLLGYDSTKKYLSFEELITKGMIKDTEIINPLTNQPLEGCITYYWDEAKIQYIFKYASLCDNSETEYVDNSGANRPILFTNMIPIKYVENKWVYANTSEEWYNYDNKQWANAVVLNNGITKSVGNTISESDIALWYVWIPRYKYTIFNGNNGSVAAQEINVQFETGTASTGTVNCTDAVSSSGSSSETCTTITNGTSTYTHPAFTFGNKELTGIWVGKFENSGSTSTMTIKPNVSSLRNTTASDFFTAIQNIKTTYNLSNADSHMMKNMEWGSVAYLKQSKYGLGSTDIGINNNSSYITGCGSAAGSSSSSACHAYDTSTGMLASTTGNIYGIYDMSGGAWEYVMGNMVNSSNAFYASSSGFTEIPDSKYYDLYTYDSSSYTTHGRGKLGDATKETLSTFGSNTGGWANDYAYFVYSTTSWFTRGGGYNTGSGTGVFYFNRSNGSVDVGRASRSVLVG